MKPNPAIHGRIPLDIEPFYKKNGGLKQGSENTHIPCRLGPDSRYLQDYTRCGRKIPVGGRILREICF